MPSKEKHHQVRVGKKHGSHAASAEGSTGAKTTTFYRKSVAGGVMLIVRALEGMASMLRPS